MYSNGSNSAPLKTIKFDSPRAMASKLKSLKINKSNLKTYIAARYSTQIADKISNYFEFVKPWGFKDFLSSMEILLLQNEEFFYQIVTNIPILRYRHSKH
jgi:hypothetical protein